ncbi:MAG: hypothetical protein EOS73_25450 [Mesorhizobium sp.]|uniref:hypothetical protein n=1 Tax=Mesorhizobium sp. M7A.F.Ca.ET.027.02.1.1 TaxID=2496655 RepID=UPI000FD33F35|nr:hypothetical protein [Mesorhizobium sp. M7A.F.Ca.ET.027.02.1.1]RVD16862.1 hypothetical protein EN749_10940 [Mesorhizobium sp. M7A.F.Ca.ET.027.02.1.1]RWD00500.1 MAG: hypothetical protein EOS73_25450 [Mesorhizobium sp.]
MVSTVGSISIDLNTNAAKFATGFRSSATTVEQQSSRMRNSIASIEKSALLASTTLKNLGTGLAAGAGLAALASLGGAFDKLKQTISEYDEIASNAKTTGLRTDTYQALAFAAKQANIDQESYNSSLNIFAKNAGLAATGQGALFSSLKKLNPELLQNILNTKDQEERLKLVADALAQTSDATEKAALSAAVFGKGGVEMARIFEQGRASIDRFKKTAQDLGIIVPDDLLQRAGEIDDKLDVLSTVINAQLGQSLINLAPLLVGATQGFADFSRELNATSAIIDNFIQNPSLANFARIFGDGSIKNALDGLAQTSSRSTAEIQADIDAVTQRLRDLKVEAEAGFEVGMATDRAQDDLKDLQAELRRTGIAAEAAANNAAGAFDAMLNSLGNAAAAPSPAPLPTVHRYGGNPNQIELPQQNNYQSNVNGSGVGVRSFGGAVADQRYSSETADNTGTTADNVGKLDRNTKSYLQSLSNDMSGYSDKQVAAQNVTISKLSEVAGWMRMSTAALAALVHNNDSGATGTGKTMFGDAFDSQYGSYISSWGVGKVKRPTIQLSPTSDDGSYDTSVNVQQPGNPITFNYHAAPSVSTETAKQQARDMYNEMTLQASRS